jgi:hypothetical protein
MTKYDIPRLSHVILSEAKDLMPVASGDEVLRSAQDDRLEPEPWTALHDRVYSAPNVLGGT